MDYVDYFRTVSTGAWAAAAEAFPGALSSAAEGSRRRGSKSEPPSRRSGSKLASLRSRAPDAEVQPGQQSPSGQSVSSGGPLRPWTRKKRRSRSRSRLHFWELDSDSASQDDQEQEEDPNFLSREATKAADLLDARMPTNEEPAADELEDLLAYEERTLKMEKVSDSTQSLTKTRPSLAPWVRTPEEYGAMHATLGMALREAEQAEDFKTMPLPVTGHWRASQGASWVVEDDSAYLVGPPGTKVLYAIYGDLKYQHFDMEAELKIVKGDRAGILFRIHEHADKPAVEPSNKWGEHVSSDPEHHEHHTHHFSGYHVLCINYADQRAELRSARMVTHMAPVMVVRNHWHKVRVRALGGALNLFVDSAEVGQRTHYGKGDKVFCRSLQMECTVTETDMVENLYHVEADDLHKEHVVDGRSLEPLEGGIGFWTAKTTASIRRVTVTNLQDYVQKVTDAETTLLGETVLANARARMEQASMFRQVRAAKILQEFARLVLNANKMRHLMYTQAELQGTAMQLRDKQVLMWFALFSVFGLFNEAMAEPEFREKREASHLLALDLEDPPPPAAPLEEPPQDEEMHYRYEAMKEKYTARWEAAGKRYIGQEAFRQLKEEHGPAKLYKQRIAQQCFKQANESMIEQEHKTLIQRAWRLEDDWTTIDDIQNVNDEIEKYREAQLAASAPKLRSPEKKRNIMSL